MCLWCRVPVDPGARRSPPPRGRSHRPGRQTHAPPPAASAQRRWRSVAGAHRPRPAVRSVRRLPPRTRRSPTRSRRATSAATASTSAWPPTSRSMDAWLRHSPYLRRRHLHLRRLPRLPRPAEPHPDLDQPPSSPRAGGCSPITLGPQASCNPRFPRYGNDPVISAKPGTDGRYAKARSRAPPRREDGHRGPGARHRPRAARCGTTSRASTSPTPAAASPSLAFLSAWTARAARAAATSPASTPAPARASRCSTTRGSPTRPPPPARPDLDRPLGRRGQHHHVVHPRRRLAARRPDEAVPGRPRRDLGRRHASTSTATASTSATPKAPAESHCNGVPSTYRLPAHGTVDADPARSRRCSACSPSSSAYAGKVNGVWTRRRPRPSTAWQQQHGLPVRTAVRAARAG